MDVNKRIYELRLKLEEEIDKSNSLNSGKVLEISHILDKLILEYYENNNLN